MVDLNPSHFTSIRRDALNHIEALKVHFNRVPDFYNELQKLTSVKDTHGGLANIVMTSKKKDINQKLLNYLRTYDPETREHYYD